MGSRTGHTVEQEPARPLRSKSVVREYVETFLICALAIVFLRAFVFQQSEIPSGSMEDTLLIGDHVLVNRFLYAPTQFGWERSLLPIRGIKRGDVVVFKHPPGPEQDFIKRVVGLPGETVALSDGSLYVDGLRVPEPYLPERERVGQNYGPVRIPEAQYLLLGDHRSRSSDSRVWGPAPAGLIKGRAFMVLFSTGGPQSGASDGRVSPGSVLRKLWDLVFHLRWDRCFRTVR